MHNTQNKSNSKTPVDMISGTIHFTKNYGDLEVSDYINRSNVLIKFIGYTHLVTAEVGSIRKGNVKNYMLPKIQGKGFIGIGDHSNNNDKKAYRVWSNMLERCYCPKFQLRKPAYIGCSVVAEWHNFQTFCKWFYEESNYEEGLQLDKDLLVQGNKIYSPDVCIFVTQEINSLLTDCKAARGAYPQGVSFHKLGKKFRAQISINGKVKHIGFFLTHELAHEAYKISKYAYIKEVAYQQADLRLRCALINFIIY